MSNEAKAITQIRKFTAEKCCKNKVDTLCAYRNLPM